MYMDDYNYWFHNVNLLDTNTNRVNTEVCNDFYPLHILHCTHTMLLITHVQSPRLQSQLDLDDLSRNEVELKANLYFHIGNPIKRWKVERVVPIKLLLQLLKTFCLIVQVWVHTSAVTIHLCTVAYCTGH